LAIGLEGRADLKDLILKLIKERGPMTYDKLKQSLFEMGVYVNQLEVRLLLSDLIRSGVICKEPSPEIRKFLLKICKQ